MLLVAVQNREAALRSELGPAGVARIEKQHATQRFIVLLVRVAKYNNFRSLAYDGAGDW